jgi:dihydroorotase/N-acyl-D-amino-acid deacylase|tara:strand:- start:8600 stop:10222 length:1623 start_codon:yes stop_codon:yes gene_type:complete
MPYKIFKKSFYIAIVFILIGFAKYSSANDLLPYDIIISNGRVVDGSGNPWFLADIGIKDDRIVKIGNLDEENADQIINANGLVVTPGFIDPHTHALRGIFDVPGAESALLQGVTTLTEGNDGASPFPIDRHYRAITDKKISPNWSTFVGHGTLRQMVMGTEDRKPSRAEMTKMKNLIREAMEDGALGMSTGLFYVPGSYALTEEIIELSKVVAEYGGIYISHIREETSGIIESVEETIRIGRESDIPVQITHHKVMGVDNWGLSIESLSLVDAARNQGVDVTLDQYPYTASQTGLKALIPQWAQEGGNERMLQRIKSSETRKIIKNEVIKKILYGRGGGNPKNIFISRNSWNPSMTGKNLAEITIEMGMSPSAENAAETVFIILEKGSVTAVYHAINPDDVDRIMQHPATAIGSDGPVGIFGEGTPHPRQYGSFARVLGYYVRERGILKLEQAVRKMSSQSAKRLGIHDRGLIAEGYYADIAVFDPNQIIDKATFENPHQYSVGMKFVIVNGITVVEEGKHNGNRPGKVIYGPGKKDLIH